MSNHRIVIEEFDPIEQLEFEPVSEKYRNVQMVLALIAYTLLVATASLPLLADSIWWFIAAESVIIISCVINLTILRKAYRFKGYALREHDITYRTGVIFPKLTTIPYTRIQQVSISQNPVSRYFGLCSVDIVNGAQGLSSLNIKGLSKEKADQIKSVITQFIQL